MSGLAASVRTIFGRRLELWVAGSADWKDEMLGQSGFQLVCTVFDVDNTATIVKKLEYAPNWKLGEPDSRFWEQTRLHMDERRREKRTPVELDIDVIDWKYNEIVGKLIDISPRGIRVRGEEPIELYDEIHIQLNLPMRILGKKSVNAVAVCMWSKPDEDDSSLHDSGFEFHQVSQEDSSVIIGLIMELEK